MDTSISLAGRHLACTALFFTMLSQVGIAQEGSEDTGTLFEPTAPQIPGELQEELAHVNPLLGGWSTEAFQSAAKKAMKGFFHAAYDEGKRGELSAYLAEDFQGANRLRVDNLVLEFDDGVTQAYRMQAPSSFRHGRERLEGFLDELASPYKDGSIPHAAVKVISIGVRPEGGYHTEVFIQLDGLRDEGRIQQNFTWDVFWQTADDKEALVEAIHVLEYTEVHTKNNMFSEVTAAMLGELPFYESETLRGIDDYVDRYDNLSGTAFIGSQGMSVADINGDGLDDIYICQESTLPNRLLLHNPDGSLTDISVQSGTNILDATRSALILDLDADGDQDLALAIRSSILLMYNDGEERFSEIKWLHVESLGDIFSLAAADPDLDGDLDIYASRHRSLGSLGAQPVPYFDANNGSPNIYWRNDGDRKFVEATDEVGLGVNNTKFSFASIWDDFDNDGDLDLFVSNDFGRNNLYRNTDGHFEDIGPEVGIAESATSMGVSCSDYDLDGDIDMLVSNMFSAAGRRTVAQSEKFMARQDKDTQGDFERSARGNTLFSNRGDGHFEDTTVHAGVEMGRWSWGSRFMDFNNDGYEDMYVPNGFVTNTDSNDL